MKALIRNAGETVTENMNLSFIDWKTGYPLTGEKWFGGPYTLVENYIPPIDNTRAPQYEEIVVEPEQLEVEEEIENEDDYVIIDGKKYSKKELRSLLE